MKSRLAKLEREKKELEEANEKLQQKVTRIALLLLLLLLLEFNILVLRYCHQYLPPKNQLEFEAETRNRFDFETRDSRKHGLPSVMHGEIWKLIISAHHIDRFSSSL